jgi:septal ring-binding cell division protein DamX
VWIVAAVLTGAALGAGGYALFEQSRAPAAAPVTAMPAPSAAPAKPVPSKTPVATTPPAPEPKQPLDVRLAATTVWLTTAPDSALSVQLLSAGNEEELKNHLNNLVKSIDINDIFVYRSEANRQPTLTLLYGNFSTVGAATEALARLPAPLKANRPLVRTVQNIRAEIRQYRGP